MAKTLWYALAVMIAGMLNLYAHAQEQCGFDVILKEQRKDPAFNTRFNSMNEAIRGKVKTLKTARTAEMTAPANIVNTAAGPVYQIPVVVHVVHTGGAIGSAYNPSDAQINGMIDFLNQVYGATAGTGGVNIPIRFALAKRTPDCQPTNGINRVNGTVVAGYADKGIGDGGGAPDREVKALSRWPNTSYYNIWLVWKIYSNVAGYAHLPGANAEVDGTVMMSAYANNTSPTLAHEMGHGMGLLHTFEGSTSSACAPNNDCSLDGDKVCDTEPSKAQYATCGPLTQLNPCTGQPYSDNILRNIMNYHGCRDRFTQGQADRALGALLTYRKSLIYSTGAKPLSNTSLKPAEIPPSNLYSSAANIGPLLVELNDLYAPSSGFIGDGRKNYLEQHCLTQANISTENTISITTSLATQYVKAWIDFNNSGSFEASELVMDTKTPDGFYTPYVHSVAITDAMIASAVKNIPLRLRVMADWAAINSPVAQLQSGQTEDYAVTFTSSIALPAVFSNVQAGLKGDILNIQWATQHELNNDLFIIQASKDGKNFVDIGTLKTAATDGNSVQPLNYLYAASLNDMTRNLLGFGAAGILGIMAFAAQRSRKRFILAGVLASVFLISGLFSCHRSDRVAVEMADSGSIYVRIKQVDKNGTPTYSKVVKAVKE